MIDIVYKFDSFHFSFVLPIMFNTVSLPFVSICSSLSSTSTRFD